jgi:hypothetical protein
MPRLRSTSVNVGIPVVRNERGYGTGKDGAGVSFIVGLSFQQGEMGIS